MPTLQQLRTLFTDEERSIIQWLWPSKSPERQYAERLQKGLTPLELPVSMSGFVPEQGRPRNPAPKEWFCEQNSGGTGRSTERTVFLPSLTAVRERPTNHHTKVRSQ